jgi:DHA1 family tetracycline resistance protein-like MFS transporter
MASGVLSGLVQATLVRKAVPALGATRAVVFGLALSTCAQVGYGLATEGWMIFAVMAVGSLAGIAGPALQSYITQHVPPDEQGAVQGIYAGLASLAGIPAPFAATWLFGWGIDPARATPLPGISFFAGAAVMVAALLLAVRTFRGDASRPLDAPGR